MYLVKNSYNLAIFAHAFGKRNENKMKEVL